MSNRLSVLTLLLVILLAGCGGGDRTSQAPGVPAPSIPDGGAPPPPPPPAPAAPAADLPAPEVAAGESETTVPPDEHDPEDSAAHAGDETVAAETAREFHDDAMDRPPRFDAPEELHEPVEDTTLFTRARQTLLEGRFPEGLAMLQAAALAEEEAAEEVFPTLQWSPALKRPMLATHWGIAVLTTGLPGGAHSGGQTGNRPQERLRDEGPPAMAHDAGVGAASGVVGAGGTVEFWHHAVGLPLVQGLQARVAEGAFGHWLSKELALQPHGAARAPGRPPVGAPDQFEELGEGPAAATPAPQSGQHLRGISVTQAANLGEARSWATGQEVDILLTVSVTLNPAAVRGRLQTNFAVKIYDVAKNQELWSSRALSSRRVEVALAEPGARENPAKDFLDNVFQYVDQNLRLTDMPKLDSTVVARRAAALAAEQHTDPLPALLELRYYVARGLLDASALRQHYTAILGAHDGAELSAGNLEQRRQVVEALMP